MGRSWFDSPNNPSRRSSARELHEVERRLLLIGWNDTAVDYPRGCCAHEIFAEQASRTPDAPAVIHGHRQLSYRELDSRANQVAHYLRKRGVGPEVVVGLCIERSLDMIVGLIGILKAGGAYLPLDPEYPHERLAYMLRDSDVSLVLASAGTAETLGKYNVSVVSIDADQAAIAVQRTSAPKSRVAADNLAYVMYTSGSTGSPKGIAVVHYNISRLVKGANYVKIESSDVFLQLAPLVFDAATFEIWGALLNGARLVLYPDQFVDFARLQRIIADTGVSILWLTAGLFHRIVDQCLHILTPVNQLLAGGDALSVPHVKRVLERLDQCQLINGYGPTECTTFSVCWRVLDHSSIGMTVPIGSPVSNAKVYVLDRELEPVPVGVPGELYIGGDGLSRGYINRPGLTAERFIANPFGQPGSRLYRTGDLVRYLADGKLEYLGRLDRQLKVRGFRIEPGEIEAALLSNPNVRQAVVVAQPAAIGDKRLIAYVVGDSGALPEADQLRAYLKANLPEYMVPAAFVALDELPLTPNGKVDRSSLPPPEWLPARLRNPGTPRTPIETAVAEIWSEFLKIEPIRIHDDFFELGGTASVFHCTVTRISERFGIDLDSSAAGHKATVASLVNRIRCTLSMAKTGRS